MSWPSAAGCAAFRVARDYRRYGRVLFLGLLARIVRFRRWIAYLLHKQRPDSSFARLDAVLQLFPAAARIDRTSRWLRDGNRGEGRSPSGSGAAARMGCGSISTQPAAKQVPRSSSTQTREFRMRSSRAITREILLRRQGASIHTNSPVLARGLLDVSRQWWHPARSTSSDAEARPYYQLTSRPAVRVGSRSTTA